LNDGLSLEIKTNLIDLFQNQLLTLLADETTGSSNTRIIALVVKLFVPRNEAIAHYLYKLLEAPHADSSSIFDLIA